MLLPIAYEGEGKDGYRDQIVTCDVGVSLNSKTHPLFMKYSNGTSTHRACFLCFFYNPYMSPFHSKNFSFTCIIMQTQKYQHMLQKLTECTQCYDENVLRIKYQQTTQNTEIFRQPPTLLLPM